MSVVLLCLCSIVFSGCKTGGIFDSRLSEGIIEYDVSYPYMSEDNFMLDFLPTTMTLKFKDNRSVTELSAGFGMFRTNFITNSNEFELNHLVKLYNKKYVAEFDKSTIQEIINEYPDYTIIELNEKQVIAGYQCSKALIVYDDVDTREFYIYYTDEINFQDPNWPTPFAEINGVLMGYEIKQFNITTRLFASNVQEADIEFEEFEVPADYETVPFSRIETEVEEIFDALGD